MPSIPWPPAAAFNPTHRISAWPTRPGPAPRHDTHCEVKMTSRSSTVFVLIAALALIGIASPGNDDIRWMDASLPDALKPKATRP